MKKILVVSCTPWNANNSVGNTYANLFDGMDDCVIAHIYCADGADNDPKVSRGWGGCRWLGARWRSSRSPTPGKL